MRGAPSPREIPPAWGVALPSCADAETGNRSNAIRMEAGRATLAPHRPSGIIAGDSIALAEHNTTAALNILPMPFLITGFSFYLQNSNRINNCTCLGLSLSGNNAGKPVSRPVLPYLAMPKSGDPNTDSGWLRFT